MSIIIFSKRIAKKCFRVALMAINSIEHKLFKRLHSKFWHLVFKHFVLYRMNMDLPQNASLLERISYLENYAAPIFSTKNVKILHELFTYSVELKNKPTSLETDSNKPIYILHVCVWGNDYTDKLLNFLVPSLLTTKNLPNISSSYQIFFYIHCDTDSRNKLAASPIIKELALYSTIIYEIIPQYIFDTLYDNENYFPNRLISKLTNIYPNWKYYLLGCLQNIIMLEAQQHKAHISFLMPDLLLSEDALSKMFTEIVNKKAAAVTAFRSLDKKVIEHIASYRIGKVISIPAYQLSRIAIKSMHIAAIYRIAANKNSRFQLTAQMLFHYPNEVVIRSLHYHPLLVDFRKIDKTVAFDFCPIDSNLLCNILDESAPISNQIWVNENASEMGFIEISGNNIEKIPKVNKSNIVLDIQKQTKSPHWTSLNHFLLSKRCRYSFEEKNDYVLSDIYDEAIL